MDPADSKAADFDRRASMRVSRRISVHAGGDAGEEEDLNYQLQALGVSDGFRPAEASLATVDAVPSSSSPSSSAAAASNLSVPPRTTKSRPSSIAKPPQPDDSPSLGHDTAIGPINQAFLSRQTSTSTTSSETPARQGESPYDGPSGPSHPYQMYPQNVRVARTLSVTTASTDPAQETAYAGPRGPAHPYGLYPQNTVAESSTVPIAPVPIVGFPGIQDNYRRQLGPDGEEIADMIGPDGHTEQLPPYSRYPDEAYVRKAADDRQAEPVPAPLPAAASSSSSVGASLSVPAPAPTASIPGAGGIGLAARNPEFDPLDDADSPQSRHSSRSFTTDSEVSRHEINTAARGISEKQKPLKGWQVVARRRLWGIVPYWAICLLVTALVLMGIIMGAVIGAFYAKHKRPPPGDFRQPEISPVTVTVDATPIPTPADLPPIPTGLYSLPLGMQKSPNSCFNDTMQTPAWSCSIWSWGSGMTINITSNSLPDGGSSYNVAINCNQSMTLKNNMFIYGEQPPVIPTPTPMNLVNDILEMNRGPAWFRMQPYNKTVIVPETLLAAPTAAPVSVPASRVRRFYGGGIRSGFGGGDIHRKPVAQPGDRPWVCNWPDTILEVFIYPRQNSSQVNKFAQNSTATATPTGAAAAAKTSQAPNAPPSSPPSLTTSAGATATSAFEIPAPINPPYPRVVKLEERRMARSRQATCQQYQLRPVDGGFQADPVFDLNNKPIIIAIAEDEPGPPMGPPPGGPARRWDEPGADEILRRDSPDLSDCGCLWLSS